MYNFCQTWRKLTDKHGAESQLPEMDSITHLAPLAGLFATVPAREILRPGAEKGKS
jgi:hypothetical protein